MKKPVSILLTLLVFVLAGCVKTPEKVPSTNPNESVPKTESTERSGKVSADLMIQPEDAVSAELNGYGKNIVIDDTEKVEEIIRKINTLDFQETTKDAVSVPGAVSLRIIIRYRDGEKVDTGLPVWEVNGKVYETDPACVEEFNGYF